MSDSGITPHTQFADENLTEYTHLDPDKHWIGESLPAPSLAETTYAGVLTHQGASPFPARADHSHDSRTRFCYARMSSPQSLAPGSTYINTFDTIVGEDFRHAGSQQLFDWPQEGLWHLWLHFNIIRSAGVFPANTRGNFRVDQFNAASQFNVFDGNVPEARTTMRFPATFISIMGSIGATSNVQFLMFNGDAVNWNVNCFICLIRLASSFGANA